MFGGVGVAVPAAPAVAIGPAEVDIEGVAFTGARGAGPPDASRGVGATRVDGCVISPPLQADSTRLASQQAV